jgi:hypothetical protein
MGSMVDYSELDWFIVHLTMTSPGLNASDNVGIYFNEDYNGTKVIKYDVNYKSTLIDKGGNSSVYSVLLVRFVNTSGDTVGGHILDVQEGKTVRNISIVVPSDIGRNIQTCG